MTARHLSPQLDLLRQEYVLVQAWKKTAAYIRSHNWYADTLELDHAAVRLPMFLSEIAERLASPQTWVNTPLRIVPAPKSQPWRIDARTGRWEPVEAQATASKLRPLAHVALTDQVLATAIMLCLADRIETAQGDPRVDVRNADERRRVTSYGNRLFCDSESGGLRHRWGSTKLYRSYYQDYRTFLTRPDIAAEQTAQDANAKLVIVHSDLKQFYDRVTPEVLGLKLAALWTPSDDIGFFELARHVFSWTWHRSDTREVTEYSQRSQLADFSTVALPQGLVASGFFANLALLDFDEAVRTTLSSEIAGGIYLIDAGRYVDDLRLVLQVSSEMTVDDVVVPVQRWLQQLLDRNAQGLLVSEDKTTAAAFRGDEHPLVRQSRKMARIQRAVSGGFDAIGGEEIIDAVQGLIRSQQRYSAQRGEKADWAHSPVADVRDATVARFAAGRFRTTYRSLRPLLPDHGQDRPSGRDGSDEEEVSYERRTQADLDDEVRGFALGLVESWFSDPSNVRLLRIGLDLWPAPDLLRSVLDSLRPFTTRQGRRKAPRRVAWYCLSEIFRAGATETGIVEQAESLPAGIDIGAYRELLIQEAVRLMAIRGGTLPWYLKQQVLLFLATWAPPRAPVQRVGTVPETARYRELIRFLGGARDATRSVADFTALAVLARRSFMQRDDAIKATLRSLTARRLDQIGECDPSFAIELVRAEPGWSAEVSPRLRDDLCLSRQPAGADSTGHPTLATLVLNQRLEGALRNELSLLEFASHFLATWPATEAPEAITPNDVYVELSGAHVQRVELAASRVSAGGSMYRAPSWCPPEDRWRFQLGYLLRFILTASEDFTKVVRPFAMTEWSRGYRPTPSHWYQRLYGTYNGHAGFGEDWLPISDWTENLLFGLLAWPGCGMAEVHNWVGSGIEETRRHIEARIQALKGKFGTSSGTLAIPLLIGRPTRPSADRPLRACVVQTVVPTAGDFTPTDLTLSNRALRRRHRNHLAAALAAVDRMLDLRETHKGQEGRLDWLILPELSVHPHDVRTHLVPFARAHKAMVLAGLTYERLAAGRPLVNSAIWVIPEWSAHHGLQVTIRRQGKFHLAPDEQRLNAGPSGPVIANFRPCQWLIGYSWSSRPTERPLWLTAAVCYDATDLSLAADLRFHSDVFVIPALNRDVHTFDQMAFALHYHMFQMVVIANNGTYGGSNAHAPFRDAHVRQVFHVHGQPQASVSFFEIDDIPQFLQRRVIAAQTAPLAPTAGSSSSYSWKFPPAGTP